ncbi:V-type ATPase 116kDa subunit family protein [Streptomyces sp. MS06]|uniref:V-type ATPase 116kDa subunit family protein n=1 Tax=Streptomyces sp. MS06 TaxID=3385974 RepID=UPI0039A188DB
MSSWADRAESLTPTRMRRVAVVAPEAALRAALVRVAEAGCVEFDRPGDAGREEHGEAARRLRALGAAPVPPVPAAEAAAPPVPAAEAAAPPVPAAEAAAPPRLAAVPPDLGALQRQGRADLLAGEAELDGLRAAAVRRGTTAALAGWCPAADVPRLGRLLAAAGASLVPLRGPRGIDPPTRLPDTGPVRRSLQPLVRTYGTVPYADVDPTWPAAVAYLVMFGLMFGDAGHGLLLLVGALLIRGGRPRRWPALHRAWPLLAGAGLTSMLAGIAYGEFFGPTGVLPALWLDPMDQPLRLLGWAVAFGAVLLALAYAGGIANRWREGGPGRALYAASGVAGAAVFLGLAGVIGGLALHTPVLTACGGLLGTAGLALAAIGLYTASGGGAGGALQTGVQLFDIVVRIGSNTVSFARLAAFGLTHAALGGIVWAGTTALAGAGPAAFAAAVVVFAAGNALTFALEALVAGVQALRLEFYELFSRVFDAEGRPFRPWHPPVQHGKPPARPPDAPGPPAPAPGSPASAPDSPVSAPDPPAPASRTSAPTRRAVVPVPPPRR